MAITLTDEEQRAITALLYSGATTGALVKLGLYDLSQRLQEPYDGPWEFNGKPRTPRLIDWGVTGCVFYHGN